MSTVVHTETLERNLLSVVEVPVGVAAAEIVKETRRCVEEEHKRKVNFDSNVVVRNNNVTTRRTEKDNNINSPPTTIQPKKRNFDSFPHPRLQPRGRRTAMLPNLPL